MRIHSYALSYFAIYVFIILCSYLYAHPGGAGVQVKSTNKFTFLE